MSDLSFDSDFTIFWNLNSLSVDYQYDVSFFSLAEATLEEIECNGNSLRLTIPPHLFSITKISVV